MLLQAQAMLTQLVFTHSLRIRATAHTSRGSEPTADANSSKKSSHVQNSAASKVYTLATNDVNNINDGREFLQVGTFMNA